MMKTKKMLVEMTMERWRWLSLWALDNNLPKKHFLESCINERIDKEMKKAAKLEKESKTQSS